MAEAAACWSSSPAASCRSLMRASSASLRFNRWWKNNLDSPQSTTCGASRCYYTDTWRTEPQQRYNKKTEWFIGIQKLLSRKSQEQQMGISEMKEDNKRVSLLWRFHN
jgi:hypothetical protein